MDVEYFNYIMVKRSFDKTIYEYILYSLAVSQSTEHSNGTNTELIVFL